MIWYEIIAYDDDDSPYARVETDNDNEADDWQALMLERGYKTIITVHGDTK